MANNLINLSLEQIESLAVATEAFQYMVETLYKAMTPLIDTLVSILEELVIVVESVAHKVKKHNTPYNKVLKSRVYDRRTKLYRCRNTC